MQYNTEAIYKAMRYHRLCQFCLLIVRNKSHFNAIFNFSIVSINQS